MPQQNPRKYLKRRSMSALMLTFTVFCCVSGGPFGLEPLVKDSGAGMAILLILITPLVWALPDALTSCELAPAIPVEGGYIVWVKRAMGPFAGFLNAWWTWLYTLVDAAIYPVMFATYLDVILRTHFRSNFLHEDPTRQWLVGLVIIAVFAGINIRGTRLVGMTSTAFGLILIAPFLALFVVGLVQLLGEPRPIVQEFVPEGETVRTAFAAGLATVMWNYLGWDAMSTIAEEVDEPAKAYPRALLIGVPLVMLVYLLPTVIGLAFFPNTELWEEGAWPAIAKAVGGDWLSYTVSFAALVSPIALFTASLLASSRVPFVLAEDRFLPRTLVDIHPKFGTPWKAILVCSAVYAVLTLQTFQELVTLNVIMYSAALVLEGSSLIVLRYKEPDLHRPFKIRGGLPVLLLIVALPAALAYLLVYSDISEVLDDPKKGWMSQVPTAIALASGPLIYFVIKALRGPRSDALV